MEDGSVIGFISIVIEGIFECQATILLLGRIPLQGDDGIYYCMACMGKVKLVRYM